MAYGQISSTMLISLGVPPAAASAAVHTAETFTTAVSGISHVAHRNVDWTLFLRIVIPGIIGGVVGAYLLTQVSAEVARPLVLTYLTALGIYLFYRGVLHRHTEKRPKVPTKGVIALQLHRGPPMKVQFKDVFIKEL